MNEKIRELAEHAGLEYNFDPMLWLKQEKFAELIIEECALRAESYAYMSPNFTALAEELREMK